MTEGSGVGFDCPLLKVAVSLCGRGLHMEVWVKLVDAVRRFLRTGTTQSSASPSRSFAPPVDVILQGPLKNNLTARDP